eukprot:2038828-Prymnesium_polylepis.1
MVDNDEKARSRARHWVTDEWCSKAAAEAFGPKTRRWLAPPSRRIKAACPTPAVWIIQRPLCAQPVVALTSSASLTSPTAMTTRRARWCSNLTRSSSPWPWRTTRPLRDTRTRSDTPCAVSKVAAQIPKPPRPPVTIQVPMEDCADESVESV